MPFPSDFSSIPLAPPPPDPLYDWIDAYRLAIGNMCS